jgi:hypothetical protein
MRLASTLAALALISVAAPARADIPPPDDYVEPCTLEKQQSAGLQCVECPSNIRDREKCQAELAPAGYAHACSTYGASAWTEIWCRPQGAAVPVRGRVSSMGCSRGGDPSTSALMALGLAGLAGLAGARALGRRRRDGRVAGAPEAPELDAAGRSGAC